LSLAEVILRLGKVRIVANLQSHCLGRYAVGLVAH
jgi:hypothetical protein